MTSGSRSTGKGIPFFPESPLQSTPMDQLRSSSVQPIAKNFHSFFSRKSRGNHLVAEQILPFEDDGRLSLQYQDEPQ